MKINYNRVLELNKESLSPINGEQLSCWYLVQSGLERILNGENVNNHYINFLSEIGVLEIETQDEKRKIVEPFNFTGNGPQGN